MIVDTSPPRSSTTLIENTDFETKTKGEDQPTALYTEAYSGFLHTKQPTIKLSTTLYIRKCNTKADPQKC